MCLDHFRVIHPYKGSKRQHSIKLTFLFSVQYQIIVLLDALIIKIPGFIFLSDFRYLLWFSKYKRSKEAHHKKLTFLLVHFHTTCIFYWILYENPCLPLKSHFIYLLWFSIFRGQRATPLKNVMQYSVQTSCCVHNK